jgi:hypothetical protein
MARIAGVQFKDNVKGVHTHVTIDLKKHGEKLKPFLEEIGAIEEDEFEKEWAKGGYTVEESRQKMHAFIRSLPWKK